MFFFPLKKEIFLSVTLIQQNFTLSKYSQMEAGKYDFQTLQLQEKKNFCRLWNYQVDN